MVKIVLNIIIVFMSYWSISAPWAHEVFNVPQPPDINYGRLDNGFSYAWRANHQKPGACHVYLHVDVGSEAEASEESGMAHFLEHMAFKGGAGFPDDKMEQTTKNIGLKFGAHLNAHTSNTETVYKFDVPEAACTKENVKIILTMVRDIADGLHLEEKEVQSEKGVVDAEERLREEPTTGLNLALQDFPSLNVIGSKSIRDTFDAKKVRAFYEKWYQPQNMKLIFVGNIDGLDDFIKDNVPMIFSSLKKRRDTARPPRPSIDALSPVCAFHSQGRKNFYLRLLPHPIEKTTIDELILYWKRKILYNVLEKSLGAADRYILFWGRGVNETQLPVLGFEFILSSATVEPVEAFASLELAVENIIARGFNELDFRHAVDNEAPNGAQRSSPLKLILQDARGMIPPLSLGQYTSYILPSIEKFTKEDALAMFRDFWRDSTRVLYASSKNPSVTSVDLEKEIAGKKQSLAANSNNISDKKITLSPHISETSGIIIKTTTTNDKKRSTSEFANGVVLNMTQTSALPDQFRLTAMFMEKMPLVTRKRILLQKLIGDELPKFGTVNKHNASHVMKLFGDNCLTIHASTNSWFFELNGSTNSLNLQEQIGLLAAFIENIDIDLPSIKQKHVLYPSEKSIFGDFSLKILGDDASFEECEPSSEEILSLTNEHVRAFLTPLREFAPYVSYIGPHSEQEVVSAVARTFGTIERRQSEDSSGLNRWNSHGGVLSGVKMVIPMRNQSHCVAIMYFSLSTIKVDDETKMLRSLQVLSEIFNERVRKEIRGNQSGSYNSNCEIFGKRPELAHRAVRLILDLDPKRSEFLIDEILKIAESLGDQGPSMEELNNARSQNVGQYKHQIEEIHQKLLKAGQANPLLQKELATVERLLAFETEMTTENIRSLAQRVLRKNLVSYAYWKLE